jgi:hypothetical protein
MPALCPMAYSLTGAVHKAIGYADLSRLPSQSRATQSVAIRLSLKVHWKMFINSYNPELWNKIVLLMDLQHLATPVALRFFDC